MNSPDSARDISIKQEEPEDHPHLKSRLQVKMNSPDSARDISIKQEEPEDQPHLNIMHMVVCKEEVKRSPSLLQEEPEPPHIKEEKEEILQRPEEPDGSMLTLIAVKSDDDEDISSHCSEVDAELDSDTEVTEDSDDWEETSGEVRSQSSQTPITSSTTSQKQGDADQPRSSSHQQFTKAVTQPEELKAYIDFLNNRDGEKPFHCKHCDKSFCRPAYLKKHQLCHAEEKPFRCKCCAKSFSRSDYLKIHQRIHTGEKPFQCKRCDKSFYISGHLKKHQISHDKFVLWKAL